MSAKFANCSNISRQLKKASGIEAYTARPTTGQAASAILIRPDSVRRLSTMAELYLLFSHPDGLHGCEPFLLNAII